MLNHKAAQPVSHWHCGCQGFESPPESPQAIRHRRYIKKLSPELSRLAYNKRVLINAAESINDLRVPPDNRLEKLARSRAGQYSVRVNDHWRICFCAA
ncbi:MAG: type II toxin-antitoxin system RelE/ParE family toxin [Mycobacterium sp.]|uniref:type II toxin-antitoxin system RelE/ParE family toxin n=1 Tax=Mycobacterium sp. TaxID=1785 RepID=UPI001ECDFD2E|nr:type II toxin-antitoxin system RelE/ParE family toxin [Mycobacterium sp.]MBW0019973.1 type II toxin-antitoxin system RelE/ParE family toxin [Mycobacterium sp.]